MLGQIRHDPLVTLAHGVIGYARDPKLKIRGALWIRINRREIQHQRQRAGNQRLGEPLRFNGIIEFRLLRCALEVDRLHRIIPIASLLHPSLSPLLTCKFRRCHRRLGWRGSKKRHPGPQTQIPQQQLWLACFHLKHLFFLPKHPVQTENSTFMQQFTGQNIYFQMSETFSQ